MPSLVSQKLAVEMTYPLEAFSFWAQWFLAAGPAAGKPSRWTPRAHQHVPYSTLHEASSPAMCQTPSKFKRVYLA